MVLRFIIKKRLVLHKICCVFPVSFLFVVSLWGGSVSYKGYLSMVSIRRHQTVSSDGASNKEKEEYHGRWL